jgi:hypothetical protein
VLANVVFMWRSQDYDEAQKLFTEPEVPRPRSESTKAQVLEPNEPSLVHFHYLKKTVLLVRYNK